MKNIKLSFAIIALGLLGIASCQKEKTTEDTIDVFNATIEPTTKSHLDDMDIVWDNGDKIIISNGQRHTAYSATNINGGNAEFVCDHGHGVNGNLFYAIHPASAYKSYSTITLPTTQTYSENSMSNTPMFSVSNWCNLEFSNLTGALKLSLQKSGTTVSSISITTDKRICGDFEIDTVHENIYMTKFIVRALQEQSGHTVSLSCGSNGVDISAEKNFIIYIPVGEYNQFDIVINSTDGTQAQISATQAISFNRNHIKRISRGGDNLNFE